MYQMDQIVWTQPGCFFFFLNNEAKTQQVYRDSLKVQYVYIFNLLNSYYKQIGRNKHKSKC